MNFKNFLKENDKFKRKSIIHLDKISPLDFYNFIIENDFKPLKLKFTEKIDGFNLKVGYIDKFFIQTARSPRIFNKDELSIKSSFSIHYQNLFEVLKNNLESILKKFNPVVIQFEVLYNPMATEDENTLKFVHVSYHKDKLGKLLTLVFLNAFDENGETHNQINKIKEELLKFSNDEIKIVFLNKSTMEINLEIDAINFIKSLDKDRVINILSSKKDSESKQKIVDILDIIKNKLINEIENQLPNSMLGDDMEGIVFYINNKYFKLTTKKFKKILKNEKNKNFN